MTCSMWAIYRLWLPRITVITLTETKPSCSDVDTTSEHASVCWTSTLQLQYAHVFPTTCSLGSHSQMSNVRASSHCVVLWFIWPSGPSATATRARSPENTYDQLKLQLTYPWCHFQAVRGRAIKARCLSAKAQCSMIGCHKCD